MAEKCPDYMSDEYWEAVACGVVIPPDEAWRVLGFEGAPEQVSVIVHEEN